jgi:hypothetical protein
MTNASATKLKSVLTGPISGKEHQFLHDMPMDNLVGAFVALAAETYVLRDRLQTLETVLQNSGALAADAIEDHKDDAVASAARADDAKNFAHRVLGELHRSDDPVSHVGRKGRDLAQ